MIIGDFTYATGNQITAQRLRKIFKKLNVISYIYNIRYLLSGESDDYNILEKFILNKNINLIIGINIWRSGNILHKLISEKSSKL